MNYNLHPPGAPEFSAEETSILNTNKELVSRRTKNGRRWRHDLSQAMDRIAADESIVFPTIA